MLKRTGFSVGAIDGTESTLGATDPAKRRRSEEICAENPQLPRIVGIIFHSNVDNRRVYDIFAVDIDSCNAGDVGCIGPAVRIRCPFMSSYMNAVCVVNSSVYIFEMKKSAYRLVLSSSKVFLSPAAEGLVVDGGKYQGVVVDGGLASSIAPMYHDKDFPVALPTPDGKKIILFSKRFPYKDSCEAFELLDMDDGSWETLPPLPCPWFCTESSSALLLGGIVDHAESCRCRNIDELVEVVACSFTSNSHFLLQMPFGTFSLDLDSDLTKKEWSTLTSTPPIVPVPTTKETMDRCYIETFKDRYAFRPRLVPDWGDAGRFFKAAFQVYDHGNQGFYPKEPTNRYFGQYMRRLSAFDPPWLDRRGSLSILPLRPIKKEEEQVSNTCVLQLARGPPYQIRVLIDVCRTELKSPGPGPGRPLKSIISKAVSLSTCHALDNILGFTSFTL